MKQLKTDMMQVEISFISWEPSIFRKQKGKSASVEIKLEIKLVDHGIKKESCHGRNLTGVKIIQLFQNMWT